MAGGTEDDRSVATVGEDLVVVGIDGGDAGVGGCPYRVSPPVASSRRINSSVHLSLPLSLSPEHKFIRIEWRRIICFAAKIYDSQTQMFTDGSHLSFNVSESARGFGRDKYLCSKNIFVRVCHSNDALPDLCGTQR